MTQKTNRYEERGVSTSKQGVHDAIANLDKGIFPNAFCKILPDYFGGDEKYCNISHADGAGTKSSLAYAYWRETGDLSVWKGIAQDAIVMNLDDLLCSGVTDEHILYSSTIGRNKFLVPDEVTSTIINGTNEIIEHLRSLGLNIHFAGGETADLQDLVRTVVVDGTMTVRMERNRVVVPKIKKGAVVVGISSSGRASYEDDYNSGMGSNGLTSARHDIFDSVVGIKYPETFYDHGKSELIYCGKHNLTDSVVLDEVNQEIARMVLSPTRTYAPIILKTKEMCEELFQAMIHCSGGGQTKVLRFLPANVMVIKDDLFDNEFFNLLQSETGTSWYEMFKSFNSGHRFEVYCDNELEATNVIRASNFYGVDAKIIGHCVERIESDPYVRIIHKGETYDY